MELTKVFKISKFKRNERKGWREGERGEGKNERKALILLNSLCFIVFP